MEFGRLITAMATPFDADGAIDWEATGRLIDHLIEVQHNDSIVISGTTGESPTLTESRKKAYSGLLLSVQADVPKLSQGLEAMIQLIRFT